MKIESTIDRQGRTTIPAAIRALLDAKPRDRLQWNSVGSGLLHVQLRRGSVGKVSSTKKRGGHVAESIVAVTDKSRGLISG